METHDNSTKTIIEVEQNQSKECSCKGFIKDPKSIHRSTYCRIDPHFNATLERVVAECTICQMQFTEWISESNECPECEGEMMFFDSLPKSNTMEDWEIELKGLIGDKFKYRGVTTAGVLLFVANLLSQVKHDTLQTLKEQVDGERKRFQCGACSGAKVGHTHCCQALDEIINLITSLEEK